MNLPRGIGLAALFLSAAAFAGDPAETGKARTAGAKEIRVITADEQKWEEVPESGGVKLAKLWGDPRKGPHGALHKFPAGFTAALHYHNHNLRTVILSGTVVFTPEGGAENRLPAGSYAFVPGGSRHTTKCDPASECVIMVDATGKFDRVPVTEEKAGAGAGSR